jgi:O-antigen/teichoic acid export membrane protein
LATAPYRELRTAVSRVKGARTVSAPASSGTIAASARETTKNQLRGSSLLLAGRFLSLGVNFAIQILIVRYLSKADYGAYAYALSLVSLGVSIATFGLDRSITRFIPIYDEEKEYDKLWGTIVMVAGTILSISLGLILLVYGFHNLATGSVISNEQATSLLLVMVFSIPIQAMDGLSMGLFAVMAKPRAIFYRKNILGPLLRLTVVLLLVFSGAGVMFLAVGFVIAGALTVGLYSIFLYRTVKSEGLLAHFHWGTLRMPGREIFGFTVPLLASDLLYMVINTTDAVLVGHFRGTDAVGALRVVLPVAQLNLLVFSSFTLLFTPAAARLFARRDTEGISHLYWHTATWIAVLTFPIFALTFSLSEPVTTTLYGERYSGSATYLTLFALAYYCNAALGFNGLTLKVFGKVRFVVVISIVAAATNLALNFALVPVYGALGAAIATSSTLIVHNILKQWGLRRGTGISLFQRKDAVAYVAIAVGAGALLILHELLDPSIWIAVPLAAVASVAVLTLSRNVLRAGDTFPELARLPLLGRFILR